MSWFQAATYSPNAMRDGCVVCGNNEARHTASGPEPILSSGYEDDWAGTPEICATCFGEGAALLGWVSGPAHAKEVAVRDSFEAAVGALQSELADAKATIRTLTAALAEPAPAPAPRTSAKATR